ncbi:Voltage-gated Ion Channel (VIC) Superfamily [Achlya hypogyna]|uniref:BK channel n=1 Tax=Achlya hypogyna TaxID=1202772 RepID=A0A1V9Y9N0_ACHHY|nr:Voltage-gated Ion Channel (VIC) Superfamily [Achlya hypogyna]
MGRQPTWIRQYLTGTKHSLTEVQLPPFLSGHVTFASMAYVLFMEMDVVLLGLVESDGTYMLFPSTTHLRTGQTLFVLSSTPYVRHRVQNLSLAVLFKYKPLLPAYDRITQAWNFVAFTVRAAKNPPRDKSSDRTSSTYMGSLQSKRGSSMLGTKLVERGSLVVPTNLSVLSRVDSVVSEACVPSTEVVDAPNDVPPLHLAPAALSRVATTDDFSGARDQGHGPLFSLAPPLLNREHDASRSSSVVYSAFVAASVPDDICGHIVLCGMPTALQDFIAPLRQSRDTATVPIVVVSSVPISEQMHVRIAMFEHVYCVFGSPLALHVLNRARVATSRSIVILANCAYTPLVAGDDDDEAVDAVGADTADQNMLDTDAITLHRFVTEVCDTRLGPDEPHPAIFIELSRSSSVRFLKSSRVERWHRLANETLNNMCHPLFASGHVVVSNSLDALLGGCKKNGSGIDFLHLLLFGEGIGNERPRALDQLPVPVNFWGRPYGHCFEELLLHNDILCIGLYRAQTNEAQGSYFTHVNPEYSIVLDQKDKLFTRHKWATRNLTQSLLADVLNMVQIVLLCVSGLLYIHKNWSIWTTVRDPPVLRMLHVAIGSIYLCDYVIRVYAADQREVYVFTPLPLVELATIAPEFIDVVLTPLQHREHNVLVAVLETLRPWRILVLFRSLGLVASSKLRQIVTLAVGVVATIFVFGAAFQALEACSCLQSDYVGPYNCSASQRDHSQGPCQDFEIYSSMYFVVITISTLGYGDIAPKTTNGKILVLLLLCVSGAWIPLQISRLGAILNRDTSHRNSFRSLPEVKPHVLVVGDVAAGALEFFLHQFFHANPMTWNTIVVVLAPGAASRELQRLLLHPVYEQRVVYLSGSPMVDADLRRASIGTASACYVLTRQPSDDAATNFFTISLRHCNKDVPLFVQVVTTDYMDHIDLSGATNVVCVDQLKMGLLAKACMVPGIIGFISGILLSCPPLLARKKMAPWVHEYTYGARHMVYQFAIPKHLDRLVAFRAWAYICYKEFDMLPIGVWDGNTHRLFPADAHVRWTWTVFVLATTPQVQQRIDSLSLAVFARHEAVLPQFERIVHAWNFKTFSTQFRRLTRRTSGHHVAPLVPNKPTRPSADSTKRSSFRSSTSYQAPARTDGRRNAVVPHSLETYLPSIGRRPGTPTPPDRLTPSRSSEGSTKKMRIGPPIVEIIHAKKTDHYANQECDEMPPKANDVIAVMPVKTSPIPIALMARLSHHRRAATPLVRLSHSEHATAFNSFICQGVPDNLVDHIVLLGIPHELVDFVGPLRPLGRLSTPIVIVSPTPMHETMHARIATYGHIYFVQGSPQAIEVMHHVKVFRAKTIVILAGNTDEDDLADECLVDTEVITTHRFVSQVCETYGESSLPLPTILVELHRPESLQFLMESRDDFAYTPMEMSNADTDLMGKFRHPLYTAGKVLVSQAVDALLGLCTVHGNMIDLVHLLVLGGSPMQGNNGQASAIDQIPVPLAFWGRSYNDLFDHMLLQHGTLCVGLYRARSAAHHFAYVNPAPFTLIGPQDRLFVLR